MLGSEHGGALVMAVIWLPVLLLIVVLVVDVGNWFAHRRHLQTQADAAALAAAGDFTLPCNDAPIEQTARFYSGDETGGFNPQLGGTSPDETHLELNSDTWFGQDSPVDDTAPDGSPCATKVIDVKMTETDLPLFFQVAGLFSNVDFINTQARVEIRQRELLNKALPVGVPDTNPQVGRVTFIDEATGAVLGSREITRNGSQNGLAIWDNSSNPFPLTVDRDRIGVRVAFGGDGSTTCGQPLVECYDAGSPNGILLARGYSMAGSGLQPNAPLARNVYLTPGTCTDPYFHDNSAGCTIGMHAEVDFGPCSQLSAVGAKLTARVGGSSYPMTLASCPAGTSKSVWETNGAPATIDPEVGPVAVWLDWEETTGRQGGNNCTTTGGNKCKGSFGSATAPLMRSFAASSARSGPIHFAQLWEGGSGWANSFERCSAVQPSCTHDVVAKLGIKENLQDNASSVDDPIVELRFGALSGSQNQALDCDPAIANLQDEIATGCGPEYERNNGTACPTTRTALWASASPWDCVALETGDKTGQIIKGMNLRIHGSTNPSTCVSPNNWSSFPDFEKDDPRIVPVFITPFGTFQSSGQETVPVTGFATFYVTGWDGSQSICSTDDPSPSKSVVGHFIKYVQTLNDGSAGDELCDLEELESCVAVLTR
jgi:putative Flp pilus-assembly TadE/G-like protein